MKALAPSVASEALKIMLGERSLKATLANELGVGPYQISRWLAGQDRPKPGDRAKLEDKLGLSWRLWEVPPTKAKIAEAILAAQEAKGDGIAALRVKANANKAEPAGKVA